MAIATSPVRTHARPFCPNDRCLLHHLRGDEQRIVRPIVYRRGAILIEQGHPALGCWSICAGWIKVARRSVRGKVAGIDLRGPGELVGARALLAQESVFDFFAQAVSEVQALWIDRAYLFDLMRRFPEVALAVGQRVAQASGTVQRRLSYALHAGLEEKLAYLLLYLDQKRTFAQLWGGGQPREHLCWQLFVSSVVQLLYPRSEQLRPR